MSGCKCSLRIKLVGDGCQYCNPELQQELLDELKVNGNQHLANMEVLEYDGLKFVTESPQPGAVRLTIYKGENTRPISTETYGNVDIVWEESYPQDELCKCGHQYHRHFDSYENWEPVGCKYCPCGRHDKA